MNPTQSHMQKITEPTISYGAQLDNALNISSNVNIVQGIPVVLDNMSQISTINVNRPLQETYPNLSMDPSLQHATYSTQNPILSKYSFFYAPFNDFQMYYIICEEIPLTFENVSQLIISGDHNNSIHNYNKSNSIFMFYHEQPEIKKIYQVTCEMVSHTFIFQFLNKAFFGIQYVQNEYQQQEFSKRHQENIKFHLKKDLIHYLNPKQTNEQNFDLFKGFIQDYHCIFESTNSDIDIFNHSQQHGANVLPINSQQDYDYYNLGYYDNNLYQS
ncbi:uncharacterized protein OCT59_014731 [Rhizophagus irregularis]|uniref:Uncharacterized protein n=2 Tax=Rhizophagus irregularis TaxID=588596 RepID=A0A015KXH4_RHIIW|nr:hypothetical protein GLOIN_2v1469311 [Rhizophagus irregularis DAOM 181602=DAOM 197198]EXX64706.1 hypothetical protein RirG_140250 [Rhizophagus irregularis DAOM 197198w]UZO22368.1 hypothetical protein OCT59_014731 [Rhizophagus irregularis]POG83152.1 hypothetical protein GLOIN_2v1469311 [Rhizophagus irregularis DAOM 181602=DAOM 197198]CAG8718891.1 22524_t:CDS:1 [Rhizophagus irregularis]GBC44089.1 kinase-like domain-containing protein [Rhizophagus irregularis DAOM 181602=DAOM 197198]|eukprot:XP_025190018.1 hypothetical protein GLOIN_2v1469311 [Rhizophagus irregularis DAOM 181602=DAOM 197198]